MSTRRARNITLTTVGITIDSSKRFYEFQKAFQTLGYVWRGRENTPEYEESFDNIVNLYGKGFFIIFPNARTVDVVHSNKIYLLKESGRVPVALTYSFKNFPGSEDTLIGRLQTEYDEQYNYANKNNIVKQKQLAPKVEESLIESMYKNCLGDSIRIGVDFASKDSDSVILKSYYKDGKLVSEDVTPKKKINQGYLKSKREPVTFDVRMEMIEAERNSGKATSVLKLETMLLISTK